MFCSKSIDWLWLTFFPQEDSEQLLALRNNLTPFLKAVTEALSLELEDLESPVCDIQDVRQDLCDKIIQNVPAENSTSNFCSNLSQASYTLQLEFDQLLNLR